MTAGAKWRAGAAAGIAVAGALAALVHGAGHSGRPTIVAAVEPAVVLAVAKSGGVVAEVLAKPGDRVAKEQLLIRFEAGALVEQRRALLTALESARAMAAIPKAAGAVVVEAHPDVLAAEEHYTWALAAFEQDRASGRAEFDRATAARTESRRRVASLLSRSAEGVASTVAMLEARLHDVDGALASHEVRAPVDGIVEILDLRPGDRIAPGGPAAVLALPGEYVCEFVVDGASKLQPGAAIRGTAENGAAIEARVERVAGRPVPAALREDRRVAEETVVRARFSSTAPLPTGAIVRLELP
jgi:multidrug resistance efflux pump